MEKLKQLLNNQLETEITRYDNLKKLDIVLSELPVCDSTNIDYNNISNKLDYDNIFQEIVNRLNKVPIMKHECNSCGAILEIDSDKHIFHCPYCNSVYAIGTTHLNG